jgi:hypothetical protein
MEKNLYTLNNLPQFSKWPARLLGLEPWERKKKNAQELIREYEHEKWGPLLKRIEKAGRDVKVQEVDRWVFEGVGESLCVLGDGLHLLSALAAHVRYLDLVEQALKRFLPATALVELGAGYGSVALSLKQREAFRNLPLIAGEYTPSGVALIQKLAAAQGCDVVAGHCDFTQANVTDLEIPAGALIFTSFATPCVPHIPMSFVHALASRRPTRVVHFEPCYEHCDRQTLLGLMQQRYLEVNDYNTNLSTLLHEAENQGSIRILEERPAIVGSNPLLVASLIAWVPSV